MSSPTEHTPAEVQALLAEDDSVQLVDVREPHEHEAGAIAGDRHIPLGELMTAAEQLDPNRPVVFYCRVGGRSQMATDAFRASGWDARNMTGGIVAWVDGGLPLADPDGSVADH
ncbi:rhodanese-like domain-containing protein [Conexibacter stalactiti]|uniref:Rhodanese-like domain-containing protein n=1 Tax=Conexibacter stalactiti TaxID=1940611 RepID=A0ABU4HT69_9ACTN|nr:rhodanese-like domain-containing protein [Conexibacter stalactiti]MDW5596486.1 rhodanese-like domain-containing protein [Conexibacter stalactiti]MEC5037128.1 rhodanese-like domain-containing protein [Conexibacter stalactiti]